MGQFTHKSGVIQASSDWRVIPNDWLLLEFQGVFLLLEDSLGNFKIFWN